MSTILSSGPVTALQRAYTIDRLDCALCHPAIEERGSAFVARGRVRKGVRDEFCSEQWYLVIAGRPGVGDGLRPALVFRRIHAYMASCSMSRRRKGGRSA